uniref:Uncharacterized protein n=1 Tax=Arion vulgaris TaxID=1028688 RepID=A0A0B7AUF5_9EUPU
MFSLPQQMLKCMYNDGFGGSLVKQTYSSLCPQAPYSMCTTCNSILPKLLDRFNIDFSVCIQQAAVKRPKNILNNQCC